MATGAVAEAPLKTLRATPRKEFHRIYRNYDFIQYKVQFFGQTAGLKRSKGNREYWDIEFTTRKGAMSTLQSCKVENLDFGWAPSNIKGKMPKGRAVVSFLPPRFDEERSCEEPSLPAPCNYLQAQQKAVSPFPPFNSPRWPNYPTY